MKASYRLLTVAVIIAGLLLGGPGALLDHHVHETPAEELHCESCTSSTLEGDVGVAISTERFEAPTMGLCEYRPIPFETNILIRRPRGPPLFLS